MRVASNCKKNIRMKRNILLLSTLLLALVAQGQERTPVRLSLSLKQYLAAVAKGNLSYAAQVFNVAIAEAELKAARIFPDPEISFSYSNNQDNTLKMGQGIETSISYPISFGNKRGAALALSRGGYEQSLSALDAFFLSLRADATLAYLAATHSHEQLALQTDSYAQLRKLAQADSIRVKLGEIMEVDALQSGVEAKALQGELFGAEDELQGALLALTRMQGAAIADTLINPSEPTPTWRRAFTQQELVRNALVQHPSLKVAAKDRELAQAKLRQLKADRAFEFSLEAGYARNAKVRNEIAPAPAFSSYSAGITIPLKLSGMNRSAVRAAKLAVSQADMVYRDTEQQLVADIMRAYASYRSAERQLDYYNGGIAEQANSILKARVYAYQRGESSLVEVLNAQRSYNDIRAQHADARYRFAVALVELERAAGIWDIE